MKKLVTALLCAILAVAAALTFTACTPETSAEAVKLVAVSSDGAASYIASDTVCDYYVVPEPAATTIVNNTSGKDNARVLSGDLQELYGSENGYPQAVVVAKNSLVGTTALRDFITELGGVKEWLLDESTSVETIISAISANLTEGMTGSLSAKNLNKTVIENCCVNFTDAKSEKTAVTNIITEYNTVSSTGFGSVADGFFYDAGSITSYTEYSGTISVYAPDGAPALGLAKLMSEDTDSDSYEYHIVDSSTIQTYVSGTNPTADICVLPVNLAAKLLGTGESYKMIGTLTHGNLYILGKSGSEEITTANIADLSGKTVGVVNLANVPGLTFEVILSKYNLEYEIAE